MKDFTTKVQMDISDLNTAPNLSILFLFIYYHLPPFTCYMIQYSVLLSILLEKTKQQKGRSGYEKVIK